MAVCVSRSGREVVAHRTGVSEAEQGDEMELSVS